MQAIGRSLRLFEGKSTSTVYDFCFERTKYLKKHANLRLDLYKKYFPSGDIERF